MPHLFVCLEDVASECVVGHLTSDVAKDLHVLRVMGHIEDPGEGEGGGGGGNRPILVYW